MRLKYMAIQSQDNLLGCVDRVDEAQMRLKPLICKLMHIIAINVDRVDEAQMRLKPALGRAIFQGQLRE